MSKYLPGYSYGGERPSILAAPSHRRQSYVGDEKCPCCGGQAFHADAVCSTCKRDATYDRAYAQKVAAVEQRLRDAATGGQS